MGRILLRILFAQLVYYKHITAINNYTGWNASGLLAGEEKRLKSLNGGWRKVPSSVASGKRHKSIAWTTSIACFFSQGEHWYGRLGPCSPLRLPLAGTKLGWGAVWSVSQGNKGDSLKLDMCYKATCHLHHCLCWLGFQFSRLGS